MGAILYAVITALLCVALVAVGYCIGNKKGVDDASNAMYSVYDYKLDKESIEVIFKDNKSVITNKQLTEKLKEYPDDAYIVIEYCNPNYMEYDKEHNLIKID